MLKKILLFVAFLATALMAGLCYVVNLMLHRPVLAPARELANTGYNDFYATTEDGLRIHACFYKGNPKSGTILLCHGHGVTLDHMEDMVLFLKKLSYSILLLDFRAHGKSAGKYTSVGLHEWKDISAVISEAKNLGFIDENTEIAAYGRSMGAATLINGAANLPEIKLFILESSFEKLRKVGARDAWRTLSLPDTFISDLTFYVTGKVIGIDYSSNNPVDNTAGINNRPVLLIHDEIDLRATTSAFEELKNKMPHAKTWIAKGSGHVKAHVTHPEEFEKQFISFLDEHNFPKASKN